MRKDSNPKEPGSSIVPETRIRTINVPSDGSCLFYSILFSVFIPPLINGNDKEFSDLFKKVFANLSSPILEGDFKDWIRGYISSDFHIPDKDSPERAEFEKYVIPLREKLVLYMVSNFEKVKPYIPIPDEMEGNEDEVYFKYLTDMQKLEIWGDHPEIFAASQFFACPIFINSGGRPYTEGAEFLNTSSIQIFLTHGEPDEEAVNRRIHYRYTLTSSQITASNEIFTEERIEPVRPKFVVRNIASDFDAVERKPEVKIDIDKVKVSSKLNDFTKEFLVLLKKNEAEKAVDLCLEFGEFLNQILPNMSSADIEGNVRKIKGETRYLISGPSEIKLFTTMRETISRVLQTINENEKNENSIVITLLQKGVSGLIGMTEDTQKEEDYTNDPIVGKLISKYKIKVGSPIAPLLLRYLSLKYEFDEMVSQEAEKIIKEKLESIKLNKTEHEKIIQELRKYPFVKEGSGIRIEELFKLYDAKLLLSNDVSSEARNRKINAICTEAAEKELIIKRIKAPSVDPVVINEMARDILGNKELLVELLDQKNKFLLFKNKDENKSLDEDSARIKYRQEQVDIEVRKNEEELKKINQEISDLKMMSPTKARDSNLVATEAIRNTLAEKKKKLKDKNWPLIMDVLLLPLEEEINEHVKMENTFNILLKSSILESLDADSDREGITFLVEIENISRQLLELEKQEAEKNIFSRKQELRNANGILLDIEEEFEEINRKIKKEMAGQENREIIALKEKLISDLKKIFWGKEPDTFLKKDTSPLGKFQRYKDLLEKITDDDLKKINKEQFNELKDINLVSESVLEGKSKDSYLNFKYKKEVLEGRLIESYIVQKVIPHYLLKDIPESDKKLVVRIGECLDICKQKLGRDSENETLKETKQFLESAAREMMYKFSPKDPPVGWRRFVPATKEKWKKHFYINGFLLILFTINLIFLLLLSAAVSGTRIRILSRLGYIFSPVLSAGPIATTSLFTTISGYNAYLKLSFEERLSLDLDQIEKYLKPLAETKDNKKTEEKIQLLKDAPEKKASAQAPKETIDPITKKVNEFKKKITDLEKRIDDCRTKINHKKESIAQTISKTKKVEEIDIFSFLKLDKAALEKNYSLDAAGKKECITFQSDIRALQKEIDSKTTEILELNENIIEEEMKRAVGAKIFESILKEYDFRAGTGAGRKAKLLPGMQSILDEYKDFYIKIKLKQFINLMEAIKTEEKKSLAYQKKEEMKREFNFLESKKEPLWYEMLKFKSKYSDELQCVREIQEILLPTFTVEQASDMLTSIYLTDSMAVSFGNLWIEIQDKKTKIEFFNGKLNETKRGIALFLKLTTEDKVTLLCGGLRNPQKYFDALSEIDKPYVYKYLMLTNKEKAEEITRNFTGYDDLKSNVNQIYRDFKLPTVGAIFQIDYEKNKGKQIVVNTPGGTKKITLFEDDNFKNLGVTREQFVNVVSQFKDDPQVREYMAYEIFSVLFEREFTEKAGVFAPLWKEYSDATGENKKLCAKKIFEYCASKNAFEKYMFFITEPGSKLQFGEVSAKIFSKGERIKLQVLDKDERGNWKIVSTYGDETSEKSRFIIKNYSTLSEVQIKKYQPQGKMKDFMESHKIVESLTQTSSFFIRTINPLKNIFNQKAVYRFEEYFRAHGIFFCESTLCADPSIQVFHFVAGDGAILGIVSLQEIGNFIQAYVCIYSEDVGFVAEKITPLFEKFMKDFFTMKDNDFDCGNKEKEEEMFLKFSEDLNELLKNADVQKKIRSGFRVFDKSHSVRWLYTPDIPKEAVTLIPALDQSFHVHLNVMMDLKAIPHRHDNAEINFCLQNLRADILSRINSFDKFMASDKDIFSKAIPLYDKDNNELEESLDFKNTFLLNDFSLERQGFKFTDLQLILKFLKDKKSCTKREIEIFLNEEMKDSTLSAMIKEKISHKNIDENVFDGVNIYLDEFKVNLSEGRLQDFAVTPSLKEFLGQGKIFISMEDFWQKIKEGFINAGIQEKDVLKVILSVLQTKTMSAVYNNDKFITLFETMNLTGKYGIDSNKYKFNSQQYFIRDGVVYVKVKMDLWEIKTNHVEEEAATFSYSYRPDPDSNDFLFSPIAFTLKKSLPGAQALEEKLKGISGISFNPSKSLTVTMHRKHLQPKEGCPLFNAWLDTHQQLLQEIEAYKGIKREEKSKTKTVNTITVTGLENFEALSLSYVEHCLSLFSTQQDENGNFVCKYQTKKEDINVNMKRNILHVEIPLTEGDVDEKTKRPAGTLSFLYTVENNKLQLLSIKWMFNDTPEELEAMKAIAKDLPGFSIDLKQEQTLLLEAKPLARRLGSGLFSKEESKEGSLDNTSDSQPLSPNSVPITPQPHQ